MDCAEMLRFWIREYGDNLWHHDGTHREGMGDDPLWFQEILQGGSTEQQRGIQKFKVAAGMIVILGVVFLVGKWGHTFT